ncbi:hypothetical protein ACFYPT_42260 [Streptomyces sp. NPDC005529]|uniref:hypothetical protein n=1 Tax=unclassified Streptomyces TaxID=2593676 RepID=UPI0033A7CAD6
MSGTVIAADVTSQYTTQVTNDLESNVRERERLNAEIAALQEQVSALQSGHSVLLTVAEALGVAASREPVTQGSVLPAPRHDEEVVASGPAEQEKEAVPSASAGRRKASTKSVRRSAPVEESRPTLVELTSRHLSAQDQPSSAADVAQALQSSHPDRNIKTTVVRTTLENLVAKNGAQRSKQGSSVFYSVSVPARQS